MISLRFAMVVMTLVVSTQAYREVVVPSYCRDGYEQVDGTTDCYKFVTARHSKSDAESRCEAEGSTLLAVNTNAEKNGLITHINANFPGQFWTSGVCSRFGVVWSSNGQTIKQQWRGRTFKTGSNICIYVCSHTHKFWDSPCQATKGYICQQGLLNLEIVTVVAE